MAAILVVSGREGKEKMKKGKGKKSFQAAIKLLPEGHSAICVNIKVSNAHSVASGLSSFPSIVSSRTIWCDDTWSHFVPYKARVPTDPPQASTLHPPLWLQSAMKATKQCFHTFKTFQTSQTNISFIPVLPFPVIPHHRVWNNTKCPSKVQAIDTCYIQAPPPRPHPLKGPLQDSAHSQIYRNPQMSIARLSLVPLP